MCWREQTELLNSIEQGAKSKELQERGRKLRKRKFFGLALSAMLVALCFSADAQQPKKIPRIGFLGNSTPALEENLVGPFREGLRDLGYVEGRNISIEYRWAEGKYERFPSLIAELIALNVDLIVTAGTPATTALMSATTTLPLLRSALG